jgi:nucleoid-associated protein YgaU
MTNPVLITAKRLKTVTVPGGTLFAVAAQELGDALQWTRIAKLNGLSDPYLPSAMTLKIPALDRNYDDGGILG